MSKKIPKQLHTELSEYTALLRALKTRDLLDLSAQLQTPELTSQPKKDIWTRWPLNPKDIYVPLWELQDEVAVISRSVIKEDEPDLDDEPPPHTYHIAHLLSSFLDHIFATLALHTPPRPRSMLNRIAPLNWEFVVNTLATELGTQKGFVTERMIQNASRRLQDIYGPPADSGYLTRASKAQATSSQASSQGSRGTSLLSLYRTTLNSSTLFRNADNDFWETPSPQVGVQDQVEKRAYLFRTLYVIADLLGSRTASTEKEGKTSPRRRRRIRL
jgi:hypothetical protein